MLSTVCILFKTKVLYWFIWKIMQFFLYGVLQGLAMYSKPLKMLKTLVFLGEMTINVKISTQTSPQLWPAEEWCSRGGWLALPPLASESCHQHQVCATVTHQMPASSSADSLVHIWPAWIWATTETLPEWAHLTFCWIYLEKKIMQILTRQISVAVTFSTHCTC